MSLTSQAELLSPHIRETKPSTYALIVPTALASIYLSRRLYQNYQLFLALGPGGIPYNPIGWLAATLFTIVYPRHRDPLNTKVFANAPDKETYINSEAAVKRADGLLPKRKEGPRPTISWHAVPHRQLDQYAPKPLVPILTSALLGLAAANPKWLVIGQSRLERMGQALFVHSDVATSPKTKKAWEQVHREIGHVHSYLDGSMHLMLAPADCKLVIEQGWGERHSIAGTRICPDNSVLIYAPRDEQDAQVVLRLIRAAAEYMTGNRDLE